ncbi:hypothetical protein DTL70_14555 [Streptomyces diacarni]|uniref:Uncharacterized protein n=1 Tax=Streptomyces diacarni TaxID=2800381 RepID=A0A367EXS4_9ACTN|nr:hypothetical protein DTL70_14555 [Streptomyces diacarni]
MPSAIALPFAAPSGGNDGNRYTCCGLGQSSAVGCSPTIRCLSTVHRK